MIPVVIPFYKHRHQIEKCLDHLRRQTLPVEVFVRDNTRDNIFFTAAVNEGIRRYLSSDARYLVVLNQDMYLEPAAVDVMVAFMNHNPRCGIGAPLQLHPAHQDYVIWGGSYEAYPAGRHAHGPLERFGDDAPIPWANGACMILRMEMVREIGLMDRNLVFIGSDSDYSFTARSRGWEVWRIAGARGVHEHGASGKSGDPGIEVRKLDDMRYFYRKWISGDLYRSLAWEGSTILHDEAHKINAEMYKKSWQLSSKY